MKSPLVLIGLMLSVHWGIEGDAFRHRIGEVEFGTSAGRCEPSVKRVAVPGRDGLSDMLAGLDGLAGHAGAAVRIERDRAGL